MAEPEFRQIAQIAVQLTDPEGTIRGQVQVDTGPMRLADLVPTAYELTNVLGARANKREERAGRKISCCQGCAACCRQWIPVSPPEAFYLADLIASLEPQRREELLGRFDAIVSELERHDMIEGLFDPKIDDGPRLEIGRRYWKLQLACPFLVDESCSIYPHRPVACRDYNVTSPAIWCSQPYDHEIAKVEMPIPFSIPLARLTGELIGSKPPLIPLPLIPRWVSENAGLGQRTWPGLELFRRFMSHLGSKPAET